MVVGGMYSTSLMHRKGDFIIVYFEFRNAMLPAYPIQGRLPEASNGTPRQC